MISRLLFVGALLLLVMSPTQFSVEVIPKVHLSPVDPLIWLLFALLTWQYVRTKPWRMPEIPIFALLFVATCLLSLIKAGDRIAAAKDIIQFGEYFVVSLLLFRTVMRDENSRRRLVWVFLATGCAVLLWGAVHYATPSQTDLHVRASFGNRNVLGGYLALLMPLILSVSLYEKKRTKQVGLGIAMLIGGAIVLSGGALLGITVAFGVVAAIRGRAALAGYMVVVILVFAVLLPRLPRGNLDVLFQSIALFSDEGVLQSRYPEWQAAFIMVLENPWLGVGIGNYQAHIGSYYGTIPDLAKAAEPDIQNLYLVLASSTGIVGLVCYVGMLLAAGRAALVAFLSKTGTTRSLALGAYGSLLAFSIASIWSPLLVRGIGPSLAFVLALATTQSERTE